MQIFGYSPPQNTILLHKMNLQNWKGGRGLQPPLAPHREELSVDLSCILVLVIYLQLCFSFSYNTIYR